MDFFEVLFKGIPELNLSVDVVHVLPFPSGHGVAGVLGRDICSDDPSWQHLSLDMFVCAEQAIDALCEVSPSISTIITVSALTTTSDGKFRRVRFNDVGAPDGVAVVQTFVPLTVLLAMEVSIMHRLDVPRKLRIASHVTLLMGKAVERYPALGKAAESITRSERESSDIVTVDVVQLTELGMTIEEFEECQKAKYIDCYRVMRTLVAPNIARSTLPRIIAEGVPQPIAQRIWENKILWLLCMHPSDLPKVHIADLRSKYQFQGLDLFEMRAVWHCIPEWSGDSAKAEWRHSFKRRLDALVLKEINGTLSPHEARHGAYEGFEGLSVYDPDMPLLKQFSKPTSSSGTIRASRLDALASDASAAQRKDNAAAESESEVSVYSDSFDMLEFSVAAGLQARRSKSVSLPISAAERIAIDAMTGGGTLADDDAIQAIEDLGGSSYAGHEQGNGRGVQSLQGQVSALRAPAMRVKPIKRLNFKTSPAAAESLAGDPKADARSSEGGPKTHQTSPLVASQMISVGLWADSFDGSSSFGSESTEKDAEQSHLQTPTKEPTPESLNLQGQPHFNSPTIIENYFATATPLRSAGQPQDTRTASSARTVRPGPLSPERYLPSGPDEDAEFVSLDDGDDAEFDSFDSDNDGLRQIPAVTDEDARKFRSRDDVEYDVTDPTALNEQKPRTLPTAIGVQGCWGPGTLFPSLTFNRSLLGSANNPAADDEDDEVFAVDDDETAQFLLENGSYVGLYPDNVSTVSSGGRATGSDVLSVLRNIFSGSEVSAHSGSNGSGVSQSSSKAQQPIQQASEHIDFRDNAYSEQHDAANASNLAILRAAKKERQKNASGALAHIPSTLPPASIGTTTSNATVTAPVVRITPNSTEPSSHMSSEPGRGAAPSSATARSPAGRPQQEVSSPFWREVWDLVRPLRDVAALSPDELEVESRLEAEIDSFVVPKELSPDVMALRGRQKPGNSKAKLQKLKSRSVEDRALHSSLDGRSDEVEDDGGEIADGRSSDGSFGSSWWMSADTSDEGERSGSDIGPSDSKWSDPGGEEDLQEEEEDDLWYVSDEEEGAEAEAEAEAEMNARRGDSIDTGESPSSSDNLSIEGTTGAAMADLENAAAGARARAGDRGSRTTAASLAASFGGASHGRMRGQQKHRKNRRRGKGADPQYNSSLRLASSSTSTDGYSGDASSVRDINKLDGGTQSQLTKIEVGAPLLAPSLGEAAEGAARPEHIDPIPPPSAGESEDFAFEKYSLPVEQSTSAEGAMGRSSDALSRSGRDERKAVPLEAAAVTEVATDTSVRWEEGDWGEEEKLPPDINLEEIVMYGDARQVREVFDGGHIKVSPEQATELLRRCIEAPDELAEPLETLMLLVDTLGADVNVRDSDSATPLHLLFNRPLLGRFLVSRGADVLIKDKNGESPLTLCLEFGYDYLIPAFEASGGEAKLLEDPAKALEYVITLVTMGGHGRKVAELVNDYGVQIPGDVALELLAQCQGKFASMKDPVETFELLERLVLQG